MYNDGKRYSFSRNSYTTLLQPCDPVIQTTMFAAENNIRARAWKLSALLCISTHPKFFNSRMQLLPEYVLGLLLERFHYMREKKTSVQSLNFLSFIMLRAVQDRQVPVIVILHGSHVFGLSTVEAQPYCWGHSNV
jgi:hypothetical protein